MIYEGRRFWGGRGLALVPCSGEGSQATDFLEEPLELVFRGSSLAINGLHFRLEAAALLAQILLLCTLLLKLEKKGTIESMSAHEN